MSIALPEWLLNSDSKVLPAFVQLVCGALLQPRHHKQLCWPVQSPVLRC